VCEKKSGNWGRRIALAFFAVLLLVLAAHRVLFRQPISHGRRPSAEKRFLASLDTGRHPDLGAVLDCENEEEAWPRLAAYYKELKPDPPRREIDASQLEAAERLLANRYHFRPHAEVVLPAEIDWGANPLGDKNWAMLLHRLSFVVSLWDAYVLTGDRRFGKRALDVILSWIANNPQQDPPSKLSWYDMAVAHRARQFCRIWPELRKSEFCDGELLRAFLPSVYEHGARLADSRYYAAHSNHGLSSDRSLIVLTTTFPEIKDSATWLEVARRRVEQQIRDNIYADGMNNEHATGYHRYVLRSQLDLRDRLAKRGAPLSAELSSRVDLMMEHLAWVCQPDGRLPQFGDASRGRLPRDFGDPHLKYLRTGGRHGEALTGNVRVFPVGGMVIFRSGWGEERPLDQELHLAFDAGPHGATSHAHRDALSFTLYACGRSLLTQGGKYSYNISPFRSYIRGTAAHNTVLVDGKSQRPVGARLLGVEEKGNAVFAIGESRAYKGVVHRRAIFWRKPWDLLVVDKLTSDSPRLHEGLFHLHPELKYDLATGLVRTHDAKRVLVMRPVLLPRGAEANVVRGQEKPFQGWVSMGWAKRDPCDTLVLTARQSEALMATWLRALPPGAREVPPEPIVSTTDEGLQVRLERDGQTHEYLLRCGEQPGLQIMSQGNGTATRGMPRSPGSASRDATEK